MAPLVSIPTRARPIATTDGASAGAKRPLRAKASQITQARPTERIAPSAERIRLRVFITYYLTHNEEREGHKVGRVQKPPQNFFATFAFLAVTLFCLCASYSFENFIEIETIAMRFV